MKETQPLVDLLPGAGVTGVRKVVDSGWCFWTVAVALPDGGELVYSPTDGLSDQGYAALPAPRFLLAPNHFHHLGMCSWLSRYPKARAFASDIGRPRIEKKTGLALSPLREVSHELPSHVTVLQPEGNKAGEVWLRVECREGIAWVVCDAFFNIAQLAGGISSLPFRLSGTAPGLRIGGTLPLLHLSDKHAYKDWVLKQLQVDRPNVLVPSHGDVARGTDLSERLTRLVQERL
jgi:hypothetical protein